MLQDTLSVFKTYCEAALSLVFPIKCAVCDCIDTKYICENCTSKFQVLGDQICRICGAPSLTDKCRNCINDPPSFTSARAVAVFENELRTAIHAMKYYGIQPVAKELSEMMINFALAHPAFFSKVDLIIPVPIHIRRERLRGFNQAVLLAEPLSRALSIHMDKKALVRNKSRRPQVDLTREQRIANVQGVFTVRYPEVVRGKNIMLVDDVLTTGSTADSASRELLKAGAKSVCVFTAARD